MSTGLATVSLDNEIQMIVEGLFAYFFIDDFPLAGAGVGVDKD